MVKTKEFIPDYTVNKILSLIPSLSLLTHKFSLSSLYRAASVKFWGNEGNLEKVRKFIWEDQHQQLGY